MGDSQETPIESGMLSANYSKKQQDTIMYLFRLLFCLHYFWVTIASQLIETERDKR